MLTLLLYLTAFLSVFARDSVWSPQRVPFFSNWPIRSSLISSNASNIPSFVQPTFNSTIPSNRNGIKPFAIITFVNGIYHSVEDWVRISTNLENIFGYEVRPFYNPSSGWWMTDISRAGFDLVLRPNDLMIARDLAEHLRAALADLHPHGRVLHLAHSGGAILTYLAAKHHLTYHEIARIDVATLGGGKSITRKYFKGWVRNYYSRNDPLTVVDNRANKLLKRSGSAPVAEVRDTKHNTSFVFIEPLERNPISDHSMECRTYGIALRMESLAMQERVLRTMQQHERDIEWRRKLRKRAATLTGVHHFWDRYLPDRTFAVIRGIRKSAARRTGWRGFFSKKYYYTNSTIVEEGKLLLEAQPPPPQPLPPSSPPILVISLQNETQNVQQ